MAVKDYYKVSGNKIKLLKQACPRCGDGVFLAEHKDRRTCGKCGFMEKKVKK
ncbi:MAG: 30S ribosomal protein S27ae [Methanosarcinaceae archaeon]|nr:30S ribosomal protein S27ae [Methanosarcinaceae archaeon]